MPLTNQTEIDDIARQLEASFKSYQFKAVRRWLMHADCPVNDYQLAIRAVVKMQTGHSDPYPTIHHYAHVYATIDVTAPTDTNAHAECVECQGSGFISNDLGSRPCSTPTPARNQAEWNYYFKPVHPSQGREIAWQAHLEDAHARNVTPIDRRRFMRLLGARTDHAADTETPASR